MRRGFVSRLTPRERNLVGVLVVVLFVMGSALLFTKRSERFAESEAKIAAMQRSLDLLYMQGGVYKERLEEKQSREAEISSEKIKFATLFEEAQGVLEDGASLRNQEEKPPMPVGDGNLVKRAYSFNLRGVRLDEMLKFIETVRDKPGRILYTDSIDVKSTSQVEDRLNATVVMATWEMLKSAEPTEESSS